MCLNESGSLVEREIPCPSLAAGEVLVRVGAAGVTPTELHWDPTLRTKTGEPRHWPVPSHEFSGEVDGEPVYGMNDWYQDGALADYCASRPEWIAPMPRSLDFGQAAAVPLPALTAWQGLFHRTKLAPGETALIQGGAGAVGVFAIQLAKWRGARVVTTASARNLAFVRELGADLAIDYKTGAIEENIDVLFDVVFDVVGGETLRRSKGLLKPAGRLVTIASSDEKDPAFFIVEPSREQLTQVGELIDARKLRVIVDRALEFDQAPAAYVGALERSCRGKLVVYTRPKG